MDGDLRLVSDGDGLAVIGNIADVDRFLAAENLSTSTLDLGLRKLDSILRVAGSVLEFDTEISASSGRWVKLTTESAAAIERFGLRKSAASGLDTGVIKHADGSSAIGAFVEFESHARSFLDNPALLSGVGGVMRQLALQHESNEIRNYLVTIDAKVDDLLRAVHDGKLAGVIGAGLDIESAMAVREVQGGVDATTWSTVQGRVNAISDAIAWALLSLGALAETVESKVGRRDFARVVKDAETTAQELVSVLARCFELQDMVDVLRIDRVLEADPERVDRHRVGLEAAREDRQDRVARETAHLMARLDASAGAADARVLLHSVTSRSVVGSVNEIGGVVDELRALLGIVSDREARASTRWRDAVRDPQQLMTAAAEAGRVAATGLGIAATALAVTAAAKLAAQDQETGGD